MAPTIATPPTITAMTRSSSRLPVRSDFGLPGRGVDLDLATGDRLELPAGTVHDAVVGPDGVTCLEAHRPAGGLADVAVHKAGTW